MLQALSFVNPGVHALLSPKSAISAIPDERLGLRPSPAHPEHDARGFRNSRAMQHADIVALGDSQTYGVGATRDQAWPQVLAGRSGLTAYNMAYGGYSPVHSLLLWNEAMQLRPGLVIEAFYAGNDLFEAFGRVYRGKPLSEISALAPHGEFSLDNTWETSSPKAGAVSITRHYGPGTKWLLDHSRLLGLARATKHFVETRYQFLDDFLYWQDYKNAASSDPQNYFIFEHGDYRTIFSPLLRNAVENMKDRRAVEGLRLCLNAIRAMQRRARNTGVDFAVLLIPTKELTFKRIVMQGAANPPAIYRQLIRNEELLWDKTKTFLDGNGIPYIDALPVLRGELDQHRQPYSASASGHPNATGYSAIAGLVHAWRLRH